uniref:CARD domain-containing protein n=1 Tax=Branchiostoma floridae TaxID=7739 RepID=C3YAS2_BRAFL|eukprot:XP_002606810.1 hypothetical protein BRAFLDRAFT_82450 [Branchiostoma floridae]
MDLDTFYTAVQYGDKQTVERGLKAGVDITAKRDWGRLCDQTSLHVASTFGQTEVAELLIQHGADVVAWDQHQSTPLHHAAYKGNTKTCELLIGKGANVNAKNKDLWTSLHKAAYPGHTETCKVLVGAGAEVNARNQDRHTALDRAAGWGHTGTCEVLISSGAELTPPNKEAERKAEQEKSYQELLQKSGGVKVNRFKVFLGGNETNGKSTLKKSLRKAGVDIETFSIPGVGEVSLWDFAGQAEYAVTHNMFMNSENTVFIVLYNIMDDGETQEKQVHWWLCFIKACNPNRQPDVILVASHRDKVRPARGQLAARLLKGMKEEFKDHLRIANEVILMDCRKTGTPEMDKLKSLLLTMREALLPNQRDMPVLCAKIMELLPEWGTKWTTPKFPVMMWKNYVKEVKRINELVTEDFLEKSTQYLHHLAELLFITPATSDRILVLKPNWLGTKVFGPVMAPDNFPLPRMLRKRRTHDYITRSEIETVFQDITDDVNLVIKLLQEFQLCHSYNGREYVFPGLLTQTMPPDKWQLTQEPKVIYFGKQVQCADSTDMFSSGFFPRVQTRLMRELENHPQLWRDGAKCADRDVEGLIKLSPDGHAVNICVRSAQGDKVQCGKMLQQLENIIADVLYECSPGTGTVENVLSGRALKEHREEFYSYGKEEISKAATEGGTILHPTLGFTEQVSELMCEETLLTRYRPELVQALQNVEPILNHLQVRDILTVEECDVIKDHSTPHDCACALLDTMKAKTDDERWVFTSFHTVFPDLCMHCLECKPCPIPLACGCAFLLCAACMKSQTEGFRCPKHCVITTGLGYNTFVIAVGQEDFVEDAIGFTEVITNPSICGVREYNVKLLLLPDITDVQAAVTQVASQIQQVPEGQETFFIYYHSGHGKEQCLCFSKWREDKLYAVWSKKLRNILSGSGATKSLFILDACHASSIEVYTIKGIEENGSSSGETEKEKGKEEFPLDNKLNLAKSDKDELPEGSVLWASSRITQKSWKRKEKYSVFTKYIISGLQGGNCEQDNCPNCQSFQRRARDTGAVSLDILRDYVYDHVKKELPQTPSLLGQQERTYWMAYTQDRAGVEGEDAQQTFPSVLGEIDPDMVPVQRTNELYDRENKTSSSAGAGPDR